MRPAENWEIADGQLPNLPRRKRRCLLSLRSNCSGGEAVQGGGRRFASGLRIPRRSRSLSVHLPVRQAHLLRPAKGECSVTMRQLRQQLNARERKDAKTGVLRAHPNCPGYRRSDFGAIPKCKYCGGAPDMHCRDCGGPLLADGDGGWTCPRRNTHHAKS